MGKRGKELGEREERERKTEKASPENGRRNEGPRYYS